MSKKLKLKETIGKQKVTKKGYVSKNNEWTKTQK